MPPITADVLRRFWIKVLPQPNGCWEWQGVRRATGYGQFTFRHQTMALAHRVAWFFTHGVVPRGSVLHRCDNPPCVNPEHLFEGSRADNMHDMWSKGRGRRGEAMATAILSDADVTVVLRLRGIGWRQRQIAEHFGVTQSLISMICLGKKRRLVR